MKMRLRWLILPSLLLLGVIINLQISANPRNFSINTSNTEIVKVSEEIDGDTFKIETG